MGSFTKLLLARSRAFSKRLGLCVLLFVCLCGIQRAHAAATLLLEEPYSYDGAFAGTGHVAVYLSRVCSASPVILRPCAKDESGVVVSRYDGIAGYDWIAIPLIPYLYAVDTAAEIPQSVTPEIVASLRDRYRRAHLADIVPDADGGKTPDGNWTQLVGSSYDRAIYSFEVATTEEQDVRLVQMLNERANTGRFNLIFHNCADFSRNVLDFYFPRAVHRGFLNDVGIMTPKQAAKTLARYGHRHPGLELTMLEIPQVPGLAPSKPLRGVVESFLKSKKYVVPVAALHPLVIGGLAVYYVAETFFDGNPPLSKEPSVTPDEIAQRLETGGSGRALSYR